MKKILIHLGLTGLLVGMASCNDILDINENPNSYSSATNDMLLAGAELTSVRLETTTLNELGSFWGGYWGKAYDIAGTSAGATASSLEMITNYTIIDNFLTTVWETSYTNLYNLDLLVNQSQSTAPVYAGIAKILKGMHFLQLVDHYNNVPFSDALNPLNTHPAYDSGADVYAGAVDLISAGINDLKGADAGSARPGNHDIIFNGNITSWIRLANTLKLRALIRQSELASKASYISSELQKINNEGSGFLTEDVFADPGFATASGQQNPFWDAYFKNFNGNATTMFNAVRPTRFLLDQYNDLDDPRKALIYAEAADGSGFNGVVLGQTVADASQNSTATSAFRGPNGGIVKTATSKALFLSAAESYFLQAEAAQRGWLSGSVGDLYEKGIRASFAYIGVPATEMDTYVNKQSVVLSGASNPLERIITQKWLALNSINGAEAWNDFRRLGYPAGLPGSVAADPNGKLHPNRLRYPTSEVNTNGAEVSRQGNINGLTDKVFWQP